jgi:hypothetical protein
VRRITSLKTDVEKKGKGVFLSAILHNSCFGVTRLGSVAYAFTQLLPFFSLFSFGVVSSLTLRHVHSRVH